MILESGSGNSISYRCTTASAIKVDHDGAGLVGSEADSQIAGIGHNANSTAIDLSGSGSSPTSNSEQIHSRAVAVASGKLSTTNADETGSVNGHRDVDDEVRKLGEKLLQTLKSNTEEMKKFL